MGKMIFSVNDPAMSEKIVLGLQDYFRTHHALRHTVTLEQRGSSGIPCFNMEHENDFRIKVASEFEPGKNGMRLLSQKVTFEFIPNSPRFSLTIEEGDVVFFVTTANVEILGASGKRSLNAK